MLLDETPATLIQHTIENFNIQPDKLAVARINESLATLQQARDLRIRESDSSLKKLTRQLASLSSHHAETLSQHSSASHASEIATLDTSKFRIAKAASDLEIESERLSSQLADAQARLQELESAASSDVNGPLLLPPTAAASAAQQSQSGGQSQGPGQNQQQLLLLQQGGPAAARQSEMNSHVALQLKFYRELGIEVERDEASGEYRRVLVGRKRGEPRPIVLDPKFSSYFYADYIWKSM